MSLFGKNQESDGNKYRRKISAHLTPSLQNKIRYIDNPRNESRSIRLLNSTEEIRQAHHVLCVSTLPRSPEDDLAPLCDENHEIVKA